MTQVNVVLRKSGGDRTHTGTLIRACRCTSHNIQKGVAEPIPVRLSPVPSAAEVIIAPNITPAPEVGEARVYRSIRPQAAIALGLESLGLGLRQHRVRYEPIIPEHRVVEASCHADRVERGSK